MVILARGGLAEDAQEADFDFAADYASEEGLDDGVVAASGRIHLRRGDFELTVQDGGVVLWVDPAGWRDLRPGMGGSEDRVTDPNLILGGVIRELYAEGGVTLRRDNEVVRAQRIYYDFAANRAVLVEAEAVYQVSRGGLLVPLIVKASEIRRLSADRVEAGPARLTTCTFGEPHYELTVDRVSLTRTAEGGYSAEADDVVFRLFDIPVLWLPWASAATNVGTEPLKGIDFGRSSAFGTYLEVKLGGSLGSSPEEKPWGEWRLAPIYRAARGPGISGGLSYEQPEFGGDLLGFYQRDRKKIDHVSDLPIPRDDRGRVRLRHRHQLAEDLFGGRLTAIGEFSFLSDRGLMREYFPGEERAGKAQEDVAYLSWQGPSVAASLTVKWRANEFQTQTEYLPRLDADVFSVPVWSDVLGTGADLRLSAEAEAGQVRRVFDHKTGIRGQAVTRSGVRGEATAPLILGPVRILPRIGAGFFGYDDDGHHLGRADFFAGVRAATELSRVFPEVLSETFDLKGLRHAIDISAGWAHRFYVSRSAGEIDVADPEDLLSEIQAFDLRIRNRLQTKRAGVVVDWIDLEIRALFFPEGMVARPSPFDAREEWGLGISSLLVPEEEKYRSIARKGFGPVEVDLRARLRENLVLFGDVWFDLETDRFETWSGGFRFEALPDLALTLSQRAIRGDSSVLTAEAEFRLTESFEVRLLQQTDFRDDGGLVSGFLLRRIFHDFIVELKFERDFNRDNTSFSISVEPRILFEADRAGRRARSLTMEDLR